MFHTHITLGSPILTCNSGYIFEEYSEYHYITFVCPYTDGAGVVGGGEANGYFDPATDEMAAFIAENPEWYKDTKLMESWDIAAAPFGAIMTRSNITSIISRSRLKIFSYRAPTT